MRRWRSSFEVLLLFGGVCDYRFCQPAQWSRTVLAPRWPCRRAPPWRQCLRCGRGGLSDTNAIRCLPGISRALPKCRSPISGPASYLDSPLLLIWQILLTGPIDPVRTYYFLFLSIHYIVVVNHRQMPILIVHSKLAYWNFSIISISMRMIYKIIINKVCYIIDIIKDVFSQISQGWRLHITGFYPASISIIELSLYHPPPRYHRRIRFERSPVSAKSVMAIASDKIITATILMMSSIPPLWD